MFDPQVYALTPLISDISTDFAMKATVLVIEDETDISDLIALYLQKDGIETVCVADGEAGLAIFAENRPDLVVLDINLPGIDGYEVLQRLRRDHDVPVILVTARREDEDAILGFGMGADDYVAKPFSPKVLAARIRTHLSRSRRYSDAPVSGGKGDDGGQQTCFGPFRLDPRTFSLLKDESKVSLSPREIDVLIFLAASGGKPRNPEEIFREVWGREYGDLSTVAVHIQRIRKKIEDDPTAPRWIKTSFGRGYYLDVQGAS